MPITFYQILSAIHCGETLQIKNKARTVLPVHLWRNRLLIKACGYQT